MTNSGSGIETSVFAKIGGQDVTSYRLYNSVGTEIDILNYGGIIRGLVVEDKDGNYDDIVLGFDTLQAYQEPQPYFGAFVGRYANRIAWGKFGINGDEFQVPVNLPPHHLHGGINGFDKKLYTADTGVDDNGVWLLLNRKSPHMEEGFPGELDVTVRYMLTDRNELIIDYKAASDRSTVVNLTNHAYFNLEGAGKGNVLDQELKIHASEILETDKDLIPTGRYEAVKDTPSDFMDFHRIGERINDQHPCMENKGGYDHCYVLDKNGNGELRLAAEARDKVSGRLLEVYTTEPAVQFFSANFGQTVYRGKKGHEYGERSGFCLETQHFPDAPNHEHFPSAILKAGEVFTSRTVYAFGLIA